MKSRTFLSAILILICVLFVTCKKQSVKNILEAKIDLLTKDTLFYNEQILWWHSSYQTLAFKRERTFNSNDLNNAWFKFEVNGNFKAALSNGYPYSGNWEFIENGKKLHLSSPELLYNETIEIITLTEEKLEWSDLEHNSFYSLLYRDKL